MTKQEAAAAIGTQRLRGVRPHRAIWHPHGSPIVSDNWDHIQHSILKHGLINSSLILTLASNGLEEPIKLLLDSGTYINTESEYYRKTSLMLAAQNGYEEIVRLFLDRGAGLEIKDVELRTALMWAAESNSVPIMRLLVKQGAKLNPRNKFGETVMLSAVKCNRRAIAEYLRSLDAPE
jgi:ankyrin repeat protein